MMMKITFLAIVTILILCGAVHSEEAIYKVENLDLPTGIRMAYVETGSPKGEKLLLLHGYTDTKRSFYPTIAELTVIRPDLHILALDFRGHGGSSMPDAKDCAPAPEKCFRLSDFAADVISFMDLKKINRAFIAGHSMGSIVAQELAFTAPQRIHRMVLIGTGATAKKNAMMREFLYPVIEGSWKEALIKKGHQYPSDVYKMTAVDADPAAEKWLSENWVSEPLADSKFISAVLPETKATSLGTWIGCFRNLDQFDNVERLKNLKVPTLVIWATQDNVFTKADQALLRESLSIASKQHGAQMFWKQYGKKPLPDSGIPDNEIAHNTQWGASKAVAADLASFFKPDGHPVRTLPYSAKSNDGKTILAFDNEPVIVELRTQ
jgi:pimeloyl-ACP methyl ester carboxylesterase